MKTIDKSTSLILPFHNQVSFSLLSDHMHWSGGCSLQTWIYWRDSKRTCKSECQSSILRILRRSKEVDLGFLLSPNQWFLSFPMHQNHFGGPLKHRRLSPTLPPELLTQKVWVGTETMRLNRFPRDAAAVPGPPLRTTALKHSFYFRADSWCWSKAEGFGSNSMIFVGQVDPSILYLLCQIL